MIELHFDKERGEIGMKECVDLFRKFPQFADRAVKSAFSSEGNRLKKLIKLSIERGGLHGEWPKQNPHTGDFRKGRKSTWEKYFVKNWKLGWKGEKGQRQRKRIFRQAWVGTPTKNAMLRMAQAVRYKYNKDNQSVRIGFIDNPKLEEYMRHQAGGYRMPITARMRRLAFAMGMPLAKGKSEIVIPPRPVIKPVFVAEEAKIRRNIQVKIYRSIARYVTGTEKRNWPDE